MLAKKSIIRHVICLVFLVTVVFVAVKLPEWLPFAKLGFFCHDTNLMYPFRKQTFTTADLYAIVFTIPALTIFFNEAFILKKRGRLTNANEIKAFLLYIYEILYIVTLIAFFSKAAVDIVKHSSGRHRPNFYSFCLPVNRTTRISIAQTCTEGQFVEEYECEDENRIEPYLSFLSGHVAFVTLSFGITIVYIQYRVLWSSIGLFKNLIQIGLFTYGCYISLTRVSNYYHFATDCVGGFLLGLLFVFISCYIVKETLTEEMQNFSKFSTSIENATYSTSIQTVY